MEKNNRAQEYRNIRNIRELHYQRRLISSRIDNEEIMIMYKLRCVWDFMSPAHLLDMGCRAIASHYPSFNVFYKTILYIKGIIKRKIR